ncbi:MAG TPA: HAD family hydrolase [Candidatus Limnocylindrales bacterium]
MNASEPTDPDLDLALRHAPIVWFDDAEPFLPQAVGYAVLRRPTHSPTFERFLHLRVPGGRTAAAVIEYALWTDWDIGHLYELEHVWSYVDGSGRLIHAEASWHGEWVPLLEAGRLSAEDDRPVAWAQPGKHAMAPDPRAFTGVDAYRLLVAHEARPPARGGLHVVDAMRGRLRRTARGDALARAYLHSHAFEPTFRFGTRWDARRAPFEPAEHLVDGIPGRIRAVLRRLAAERRKRQVWAVFFDLGDTLLIERSEEKDAADTTLRAELFDGAAELVWSLKRAGYLVGLVSDTRAATARNVLRQHGLEDAFDVLAISESIGAEKPDPRIFQHALSALGLRASEAGHVAMVGNRLDRDVRGANALGLISVWMRLTDPHPADPVGDGDRPRHTVTSHAELRELLRALG